MKKSLIIQILQRILKKTYRRLIFCAMWAEETTPHEDGTHGMGILFVAKFGKVQTDTVLFASGAQRWKDAWRRRFQLLGLKFDEGIIAT